MLSYGHANGRSRSRTGGLLRIREALYHLSYPLSGRGWARTSSLLFVRQALSRLSYSPVDQIRDKGSNLDLHVQSVASCRLDDPGTNSRPSVHLPRVEIDAAGERTCEAATRRSLSRPTEAERCFLCHSPTLRPWIVDHRLRVLGGRRPTWRGFGARASCAGLGKAQAKANA